MSTSTSYWLQWIMVLVVLIAAVSLAVKNNTPDIVFNLCTLCFGYYFGASRQEPPPKNPA